MLTNVPVEIILHILSFADAATARNLATTNSFLHSITKEKVSASKDAALQLKRGFQRLSHKLTGNALMMFHIDTVPYWELLRIARRFDLRGEIERIEISIDFEARPDENDTFDLLSFAFSRHGVRHLTIQMEYEERNLKFLERIFDMIGSYPLEELRLFCPFEGNRACRVLRKFFKQSPVKSLELLGWRRSVCLEIKALRKLEKLAFCDVNFNGSSLSEREELQRVVMSLPKLKYLYTPARLQFFSSSAKVNHLWSVDELCIYIDDLETGRATVNDLVLSSFQLRRLSISCGLDYDPSLYSAIEKLLQANKNTLRILHMHMGNSICLVDAFATLKLRNLLIEGKDLVKCTKSGQSLLSSQTELEELVILHICDNQFLFEEEHSNEIGRFKNLKKICIHSQAMDDEHNRVLVQLLVRWALAIPSVISITFIGDIYTKSPPLVISEFAQFLLPLKDRKGLTFNGVPIERVLRHFQDDEMCAKYYGTTEVDNYLFLISEEDYFM